MSGMKTREKRERRVSSPVAALLASKRKRPNTPSCSPGSTAVDECTLDSSQDSFPTKDLNLGNDDGSAISLKTTVESQQQSTEPPVRTDNKQSSPDQSEVEKPACVFKNPAFIHPTAEGAGLKKKVWKNVKQIMALEKSTLNPNSVTYGSIEVPPSFKPAKKYCDITGLEARYTDPHTKLRYARTEEYSRIRMLPSDIVSGLLALRKANSTVP